MTLNYFALMLLLFTVIFHTATALSHGNIGCFADLSYESDRKTDIVIYRDTTISTFKQRNVNTQAKEFDDYHSFTAQGPVQSVSAMDYTKNGVVDLFVVSLKTDGNYTLNVYEDNGNTFAMRSDAIIDNLSEKYVLVMDANGDFTPDVFGKNKSHSEGVWIGPKFTEFRPLNVDGNNIDMASVSFIDMDQDCRADFVYITHNNEVKMISGMDFHRKNYKSQYLFTLLNGTHQSRMFFADVNKDGAMDIIIPSKDDTLQLFVQHKDNRLGFKQLCTRAVTVRFNPSSGITLNLKDSGTHKLKPNLPIIVQDINMNSETNIITVLEDDSGQQKVLVSSVPYIPDFDKTVPNELIGPIMKRDSGIESKFGIDGVISYNMTELSFFHSGVFPLGLHFLVRKDDYSLQWIDLENLLTNEPHGFLSVCPLNDVDPTEKRYGATMPGVTVKAFFRSKKGEKIFLSAGTLYQTNTQNHLLPFIVFGLGDPDSYIEKLVIGYSLYDSDHFYAQPGVPPNSQLVLFAYKDRYQWRLETFLAPYITAPILAIIIAVVMTILGGIWLYLEIQEKRAATHDQLKAGSTTANNFFF